MMGILYAWVIDRQPFVDYRRSVTEPLPAASRRREMGVASARSMLLTVLGEFVHPRHSSVWTATLLEALGAVGVEEKSARQSLSRTASEGLLTSTRHGRRVLWALTPSGADLLDEGTHRIYGFMRSVTRGTAGGWC